MMEGTTHQTETRRCTCRGSNFFQSVRHQWHVNILHRLYFSYRNTWERSTWHSFMSKVMLKSKFTRSIPKDAKE